MPPITPKVQSKFPKRVLKLVFDLFFNQFSKIVLHTVDVVWLQRFLSPLARDFIHRARGFSYDFSRNGEQELIQKIVFKFHNLVFFDVGANIGDYTSKILSLCDYRASGHLFDLDSELNRQLALRFNGSNVRVNNFGLSNRNESVRYSHFPDFPAVNSLLSVDFAHLDKEISVAEVKTGDSYCDEAGIDRINFLKIDVGGSDEI